MIKQLFILLLTLCCISIANAEKRTDDVESWSYYPYNLLFEATSDTTASVAQINPYYFYARPGLYGIRDEIIIPSTDTHNGKLYTVTSVGRVRSYSSCKPDSSYRLSDSSSGGPEVSIYLPETITEINRDVLDIRDLGIDILSIKLPSSLRKLGDYALYWAAGSFQLNEGLESIGFSAIRTETLNKRDPDNRNLLQIPASVKEISVGAIAVNASLSHKNIRSMTCHALVPPEIVNTNQLPQNTNNKFVTYDVNNPGVGYDNNIRLYVPAQSLDIYKKHPVWGGFKDIYAIGDTTFRFLRRDMVAYEIIGNENYSNPNRPPRYAVVVGCDSAYYKSTFTVSKQIELGNNIYPVTEIAEYAFGGSLIDNVNLPESIEQIGEGAFRNCSYAKITSLPDNIKQIGVAAFMNVEEVILDKMPPIGIIADSLFYGSFVAIREFNENVTEIGKAAFAKSSVNLPVSFPSSIRKICPYAFFKSNIWSVHFRDGLLSIGEGAFKDCNYLRELRLPGTVTELNDQAFAGCKELNKIYYNSTEPVVANENIFDNYAATLYIPKGCTGIYRATVPWKYFLDIQEIDFSGIDGVESDECSDAPVEYYNLQGMRVENPTSGIYIRRQGSKTSKVFINQD